MIEKQPNVYRDGNLTIVAYPSQDGLGTMYLRAKAEGLLDAFFHETPLSLFEFLNWAMEEKSLTMGVLRETSIRSEWIGLGKFSVPQPRGDGKQKAEVAMLFFREFQQRTITLPACRMMLQMGWDHMPDIAVVYGSIPEPNRASLRFMKAIGFDYLPKPLPHYTSWKGQPCGMYTSWMTREDFHGED